MYSVFIFLNYIARFLDGTSKAISFCQGNSRNWLEDVVGEDRRVKEE
jgi:hypothetical protein